MKKIIISIVLTLVLIATAMPLGMATADEVLPLDHVVLTPNSVTIVTNGTQQFIAVGQDSANVAVTGVTYTWSVIAGTGSISASGLYTAAATAGISTIQVTVVQGSITKTAQATVNVVVLGVLHHIVLTPSSVSILVGGTQQFTAQGQDINNIPITTGLTYNWEVVNDGGTISNLGVFTADSNTGTYTDTVKVTATENTTSVTASATVIVNSGPNKNKSSFSPSGWLQGLKKGWQGRHFPPGWFKNGKANQTNTETTTVSPKEKGNQNNKGNKNK